MMTCDNVTLGEMCEADGVLARGRGEVMVRIRGEMCEADGE